MADLCVNVDHVATLRQARREREPDPVSAAVIVEAAGAQGITAHLREDRRHIQDRDVELLRQVVKTKLNLEMAATEEMVAIALRLKPDECTLVPEKRAELTTEGGLDVVPQVRKLQDVCGRLRSAGIEVSLFIDPDPRQVEAARQAGADTVELHTGCYAQAAKEAGREQEYARLLQAAQAAQANGLKLNAGHGLDYRNVKPVAALPNIRDLNIGFSIIARSLWVGLDLAVREMLALVEG
jgi:pyridoxine 5-phosphate synthase